ncbi:MAG: ATP-binding protein [Caldimonas sp.]
MSAQAGTWRADTLGVRLFLLMWAALVLSHAAAYFTVHALHVPGADAADRPPFIERDRPPLPTFPSLPPMPGLGPGPGIGGPGGPGGPSPDGPPFDAPSGPPPFGCALPWKALLVDYGVRLAVIAAAAWWGSRWLARPVGRLVEASSSLSTALARGRQPTPLDEMLGTREVRDAAVVFNRMAGQIKQHFDARGLMIAAISHDLRTPLTRMRMRLETSEVETTLRERCVADIREMNSLVDTVLEVFRSPGGASANAPSRVDVSALAQALVDDLVEQGAPVTCHTEPAVTQVEPVALRRIVGNLVENAIRYGGSAAVEVARREGQVVIRIDDTGPGIPDDQLEAVLQPFHRLEGSRSRESGGTGLGLFIAKELAERQGGELRLSNREGGGLRAEVTLPA